MRIGIIGAGFIGRAVAQLVIAAGHEAMLSNSRGPKTMSSVVSGIPNSKVGTIEDAAQFGEVVLVAIPLEHYRSVPAKWLEAKSSWMPTTTTRNETATFPPWTDSKPPPVACSPSICPTPKWSRFLTQSLLET